MKTLLILTALLAIHSLAYADVDSSDLAIADESIDSPTLNIEGQYQEKAAEEPKAEVKKVAVVKKVRKPLSASDRLRLYREQLEVRNRMMVEKKMEQIRLQQELALAKQLERSMNKTIEAIDSSIKE